MRMQSMAGACAGKLVQAATAPFRWLLRRAALAVGEREVIDGFTVIHLADSQQRAERIAKISAALRLIAENAPRRYARMQRDVRRLVIMPAGGSAGAYWASEAACVLSGDHVLRDSAASVAFTVVHEATHARLHRAGLQYRPAQRGRIEAVCLRAEIEFGSYIPGAEALVAEAREAHRAPWWDDETRRARRAQHLRALGWPEWLVRASDVLFRA